MTFGSVDSLSATPQKAWIDAQVSVSSLTGSSSDAPVGDYRTQPSGSKRSRLEMQKTWITTAQIAQLSNCAALSGYRGHPIALSLVLSVVQRYQINQVPCAKTMLYLDDRTILARNINHVNAALNIWQRLETVTRTCTNTSKTQPIARSWAAYVQFEQQGWSERFWGFLLGIFPRGPSQKEPDREKGLLRIAYRSSARFSSFSRRFGVPCSHKQG